MEFRRLLTHPFLFGWAVLATLVIMVGLDRISGDEGARSMLARVGESVSQQVVVIGHRVVQQVEVIGHRLRGRD